MLLSKTEKDRRIKAAMEAELTAALHYGQEQAVIIWAQFFEATATA